MCDTVGFAPTGASGKEVRCANAECLVPLFTAPDFAAPKPVEPEPKSSLAPTLITFGLVAAILMGGAAFWWFGLRKETPPTPSPIALENGPPPNEQEPVSPDESEPTEVAPSVPAPRDTLAVALRELSNSAETVAQPQRQTLRRSLAAESYALAGDIEAARGQLKKIDLNPANDPFYKIAPLAEIAWQHMQKGDEAGARTAVDELLPLSSRIPSLGFEPARVVIDWSTIASRLGHEEAARELVQVNRDDGPGEQLLAQLRSAAFFNRHNLNAEYTLRPVRPWREAKSVGATFSLLNHGSVENSLTWADGFSDPFKRAENLAAWAEGMFAREQTDPGQRVSSLQEAVANLEPAQTAFVLSRAAIRSSAVNDQGSAKELLAGATEALGKLPEQESFTAQEIVQIYQARLPDQSQLHFRVAAISEAVHASVLAGQKEQAASLLSDAIQTLSAASPNAVVVESRQQEVETRGISGLAPEFKGALNLSSDSQAESAAIEYRRKLVDLREAADAAVELKAEVLARAMEWNLGTQALDLAKSTGDASDSAALNKALGGRLVGAAELAGDKATADAIRASGITNRDVTEFPALALTVRSLVQEKKFQDAGRQIHDNRWRRVDRSDRLSLGIRIACALVESGSIRDALDFTRAIGDEVSREEVYRSVAAFAAHTNRGYEVVELLSNFRLTPTEQASLYRGLAEGLISLEAIPATSESGSRTPASGAQGT